MKIKIWGKGKCLWSTFLYDLCHTILKANTTRQNWFQRYPGWKIFSHIRGKKEISNNTLTASRNFLNKLTWLNCTTCSNPKSWINKQDLQWTRTKSRTKVLKSVHFQSLKSGLFCRFVSNSQKFKRVSNWKRKKQLKRKWALACPAGWKVLMSGQIRTRSFFSAV